MKNIAIILSFLIVVLTIMPCVDVAASDTDCYSIVQQDHEHNHSSDVDLCTPFCVCHCCQTYAQISFRASLDVNLVGINQILPIVVQNEIKSAISFWRPPKA